MIRVSPEKGEDRIRRYSKIITPGLGVPVPDQNISRLSSMDAATLQNRVQLQEVDDRRMTQPLLPSPTKIMGYNSVPTPTIEAGSRLQESSPGDNTPSKLRFNINVKKMEPADDNNLDISHAAPQTKPSSSPKNLFIEQQTIQETSEENVSSMKSGKSGKSAQAHNLQAMLAEIQKIGQKIDACNDNLTQLKSS